MSNLIASYGPEDEDVFEDDIDELFEDEDGEDNPNWEGFRD